MIIDYIHTITSCPQWISQRTDAIASCPHWNSQRIEPTSVLYSSFCYLQLPPSTVAIHGEGTQRKVYVHVCIYVCVGVQVYMCVCMCIYMRIYVHMYIYMCVCVCRTRPFVSVICKDYLFSLSVILSQEPSSYYTQPVLWQDHGWTDLIYYVVFTVNLPHCGNVRWGDTEKCMLHSSIWKCHKYTQPC